MKTVIKTNNTFDKLESLEGYADIIVMHGNSDVVLIMVEIYKTRQGNIPDYPYKVFSFDTETITESSQALFIDRTAGEQYFWQQLEYRFGLKRWPTHLKP